LQGQLGAHEKRTERLESTVGGIDAKLDLVLTELAVQRGERRARHGIAASTAAVVGTVATLLVQWITTRQG
jgi:hypothetical protein